MKPFKLFFPAILLMLSLNSVSQNVRLNAYTAGVFDDKFDSYYDPTNYYNGVVKGGFQWGAGLEYMAHAAYGVELSYLHQSTHAPTTYYKSGVKTTNFDLSENYIMLGGNRYLRKPGSKVEGFGGAMIGVNFLNLDNPDNGNSSSKTFFAWGIKGGCNIWASEKVGIKLQAQLLSAVQSVGGGFYFGTGGTGAGLAAYSSMYQFGLGGGLVFKLGNPSASTQKK